MLLCGDREAMVMALPSMPDSSVSPFFHGCPAVLHRHFPSQSPPSPPLDLSLHSQHQPSPWNCFTFPKLQLPATVSSRGPSSLPGMAAARTVWFSFYLGCHRSAVSLSALNVSPLTQTITPFLHPAEFCVVLYILFLWSGSPFCSQLEFCMHFCVWRCIPAVSVERDALQVHLLFCHLVLSVSYLFRFHI